MTINIFKPKTIKISDYFKIINPEYIYLQLIPHNSIRNYNSDRIAKAISTLYLSLSQRIHRHDKKMFIYKPSKVAYYVYITKDEVSFYFIIPSNKLSLIRDKIGDTWKGITIKKVDTLPTFSNNTVKYYLTYRKEDPLSLAIDKRTNTLLSSTLNVIDILEDNDKVGVFYNFIPVSQYTWRAEYETTIDKIKESIPIDKEKFNIVYILKIILIYLMQTIDSILNSINELFGAEPQPQQLNFIDIPLFGLTTSQLSIATKKKKEDTILNTQIVIISESKDKIRMENNAISICQSFKSISEDNELKHKKLKHNVDIKDYYIKGADTIKTGSLECQNFLALPARELLEEYDFIEKIDTLETEIPNELQDGIMCIGENTYKGKKTKAYLTDDREYKNLTLAVIAPTRAGKTTLLQNLCNDAINNNECVIIPDFVSHNQFSSEIEQVTKQKLIIDCGNLEKLEGLGFNETWGFTKTPLEKYDIAKEQTVQLSHLIDCINENDKSLSAKMDRYLEAAANIVFINQGSIGNVYDVLRNYYIRKSFIEQIPKELLPYLQEYIDTLNEINEYNKTKDEIIGTKISTIAGILDRFNRLKKNTAMEIMLKNDCKNNINLLHEIQKSQIISIKMPERRYKTEQEKDFLTTYWLNKLWQSLQIRDDIIKDRTKRMKVNLVIDELYQVPQAQRLLTEKLSQIAKFDCKVIISCHHLTQIPTIRKELKSANTSYMLISGCDKDNYKELKEELYPYELDDLLNLQQHYSLNLIKYEKGYAKFITKLPKPII